MQLITNHSFKIHDLKKMPSQLCAKIFHHKIFFNYNPFFNIERQNFSHLMYIIYLRKHTLTTIGKKNIVEPT